MVYFDESMKGPLCVFRIKIHKGALHSILLRGVVRLMRDSGVFYAEIHCMGQQHDGESDQHAAEIRLVFKGGESAKEQGEPQTDETEAEINERFRVNDCIHDVISFQ